MKYEIHKWSNGIYSPVWVECDGVKIADFGHSDQEKSLQYAELFIEALNSKLYQPTVSDTVCPHYHQKWHGTQHNPIRKCETCGEILNRQTDR